MCFLWLLMISIGIGSMNKISKALSNIVYRSAPQHLSGARDGQHHVPVTLGPVRQLVRVHGGQLLVDMFDMVRIIYWTSPNIPYMYGLVLLVLLHLQAAAAAAHDMEQEQVTLIQNPACHRQNPKLGQLQHCQWRHNGDWRISIEKSKVWADADSIRSLQIQIYLYLSPDNIFDIDFSVFHHNIWRNNECIEKGWLSVVTIQ